MVEHLTSPSPTERQRALETQILSGVSHRDLAAWATSQAWRCSRRSLQRSIAAAERAVAAAAAIDLRRETAVTLRRLEDLAALCRREGDLRTALECERTRITLLRLDREELPPAPAPGPAAPPPPVWVPPPPPSPIPMPDGRPADPC